MTENIGTKSQNSFRWTFESIRRASRPLASRCVEPAKQVPNPPNHPSVQTSLQWGGFTLPLPPRNHTAPDCIAMLFIWLGPSGLPFHLQTCFNQRTPQSHIPVACVAIVANTGKACLKLGRGEGEKRVGGGIRRFTIFDGWKIHRKSIAIHFGHAMLIGDVSVERTFVERTFVERTVV